MKEPEKPEFNLDPDIKWQSPEVEAQKELEHQFELAPLTNDQERLRMFAKGYHELCQKYNLYIDGCGCCESPFLQEEGYTKLAPYLHEINYIKPDNIERQIEALINKNPGKF
jgi:hypothetical protein